MRTAVRNKPPGRSPDASIRNCRHGAGSAALLGRGRRLLGRRRPLIARECMAGTCAASANPARLLVMNELVHRRRADGISCRAWLGIRQRLRRPSMIWTRCLTFSIDAARLRWQALDIEPTFRQLRSQISDTSSLELLLNPGCRVIVPDHLADSILLEQNGVFPNHLHGIERRHLPAQHVDDSAIAVLVSDSYGESIMATATWIDESLIDDAATRRQFNWPTMIYAGVN